MTFIFHKFSISFFLFVFFIFSVVGCSVKKDGRDESEKHIDVVDALGRELTIPLNPQRVISLCPSQTECLLEVIDPAQLVAVTTVCNYPVEIISQKIKINSYPPDYEKIVLLKPDLVITLQGLIKPDEVVKLEGLGVKVLVQHAGSLSNIASNFRQLGLIFNKKSKCDSLALIVEQRLMDRSEFSKEKTFLFLFSHEPLYAFGEGNFLNEVFYNNGFHNIVTQEKFNVPFPIVSREYILENQPEYMFASSNAIFENIKDKYPEFAHLKAFQSQKTDTVNADICSRPTLRLLKIDSMLTAKFKE